MAQPAVAANCCDVFARKSIGPAQQTNPMPGQTACQNSPVPLPLPALLWLLRILLVSIPESVSVYVRRKWWCTRDEKGGECMFELKEYCCSTNTQVPLLLRLQETTSTSNWFEDSIIAAESLHVVISAPNYRSTALLRGAHLFSHWRHAATLFITALFNRFVSQLFIVVFPRP
jgi:hypothetical protein